MHQNESTAYEPSYTLSPKPQTINSIPEAPNPKPEAPNRSPSLRYWGAVPDRGLAYLVPYDADSIGLLHLDSESFVTIDACREI